MYCWGFIQRVRQRFLGCVLSDGLCCPLSGATRSSYSHNRPYAGRTLTYNFQIMAPNVSASVSVKKIPHVNISPMSRLLHSKETNVKREKKKGLLDGVLNELQLERDYPKSFDDWETFKVSMLDQISTDRQREALAGTWYVSAMRVLGRYGQYQLAKSLAEYVKVNELKESILFMTSYMVACSSSDAPEAQQQVLNIYKEILEKTEYFDNNTGADIVRALCKTSLWEDSLKIIEKLEKLGSIQHKLYSHILSAALCNNHNSRAYEVLECLETQPEDFVYSDVIKRLDTEDAKKAIYKLLNKSREKSWVLSMNAAMKLKDFFEGLSDEKWSGSLTTVNVNGECTRCHKVMDHLEMTSESFDTLHKAYVESSLLENVFLKTTPEELTIFKKFVEKYGPFEVVIDGLNILHQTIKSKHTNKKFLREQQQKAFDFLEDVIKKLNDGGRKKVLIVTRKHIKHWDIQRVRAINKIATMFFTQDLSEDDCFMLYAALYSGPTCRLCSNDELTDHKFVMPQELRETFMLWQRSHQVMVTVGRGNQALINDLQKYDIRVTLDEHEGRMTSIHVPYDDLQDRVSYKRANSWLCLTSKS